LDTAGESNFMAQHDYSIANASGAAVRSDLNSALSAIATLNSGATAPTTTFAYMLWPDTTAGLLKQRNAGNTDWVTLGTLGSLNLGHVGAPGSAGTADQVLATDGSGVQSWVDRQRLVQSTAQLTTSGTFKDFLTIPSWVKKISVALNGVSTSGTSSLLIQVGTSSGVVATGYSASSTGFAATSCVVTTATTGFQTENGASVSTAASTRSGVTRLMNVSGNVWVAEGVYGNGSGIGSIHGGTISLAGVLDRVRLTTVNGTDTFDAGSVNIIYEG
jgi:hypothetical protein